MRRSLLLLMLPTVPIALSSCSDADRQAGGSPENVRPVDAVTEEMPASPDISVSAAPGVAFNYRYAFSLPSTRIAAVQEEHAQACEKLGLSRCRITGMRYRLVSEQRVEAMLVFKLDPAIARQFGKAGIDAVNRVEGQLVDSEITGHDAGAAIKTANRNVAQLTDDLRRIEEQLARKGLPAVERDRLQSEAQRLRQAMRASQDARSEQEESLATTPMTFTYESETGRPSIGDAVKNAGDMFLTSISYLLIVLITLLPWLVLTAIAWIAVRLVKPRWISPRQVAASAPGAP